MFRAVVAAAVISVSALALAAPASAQNRVKVGTLDCAIAPGVGLVVVSQKELSCAFLPAYRGWSHERYVGLVSKIGMDLGFTGGGRMLWAVYAPTDRRRWALAGHYGGASAEATVGAGVGANVLFGGNNRTISLQPLSGQGQVGLNVAAGVAGLDLRPAR